MSSLNSGATLSPDTTPPTATGYVGAVGVQPATPPVVTAGSHILTVGSGEQYATIAQAVGAAHDGDTILVDAGTYTNDFATLSAKITMIGVGGMVNMVATIPPSNLKGILTIDNSADIENFSFSGSAIDDADGGNGAGVRYEGGNLVLRNDSFQHNQDGILAFPVMGLASNTITMDHDTFNQNGSGSGYTHNAYIGAVDRLTVTNSVFEQADVGHELKSRALANTINNNSFYDGSATASYDIDLPNGGADTVTNNTIEKGPNAENDSMVHFGGEGIPYSGSSLLLQDNAFVNDKGPAAFALLNQTAISATIKDNTFAEMSAGQIASGPASETNNYDNAGNRFADGTLVGVLPGSTQIYSDAAAHAITLDGGGVQAVEGGAGLLTVTAVAGHIVAIGGSGGMNYTEIAPSGGNSITTAAGSTNSVVLSGQDVLDSQGIDTIVAGAGNITAVVNGSATIVDSIGSNQWSVGGTAVIQANNSNEIVSVGPAGNATVSGAEAYLQLLNNGGNASFDIVQGGNREAASIEGGSVNIRVYSGAMQAFTGGGAQGADLTFSAGDVVLTSVGSDIIHAGSGNDTIIVSGAAQVYAGTGNLSVFGRSDSGGAKVYGNGGDITLDGDSGNITYYGGELASSVESRLSKDSFVGGAGHLTINGGSDENIAGDSGGITFNSNGGGADIVSTAAGSSNVVHLSGQDVISSAGSDVITTVGELTGSVTGNAAIDGGSDDIALTLSGQDSFTGHGHDSLTLTQGAAAQVSVSGFATVGETGAALNYQQLDSNGALVSAAAVIGGAATVHSDIWSAMTVSTTVGVSTKVTLGAGPATVNLVSDDELHTGSGNDVVNSSGNGADIWLGSGASTVHDYDWTAGDHITIHGGTGSLNYDEGPGALTFIGGSGDAVLNGNWGSLFVTGGSGNITISGGGAGMHFVGGSGQAQIAMSTAGGSVQFGSGNATITQASYGVADLYTFVAGHAAASDIIDGFRVGIDQLYLAGLAVQSGMIANGSVSAVLTDGSQVTLNNVGSSSNLATDAAGHLLDPSELFEVTASNGPASPVAPTSLALAPVSDSGVAGDGVTNIAAPTLTGTAAAGSTVVLADATGTLATTVAGPGGTWAATTAALADGQYAITATAMEGNGHVSSPSSPLAVTIDTVAPAAPAASGISAAVDGSGPTLTGTAEAGSLVAVQAVAAGSDLALGTARADNSGHWAFSSDLLTSGGIYDLTATDVAGNLSAVSAPVRLFDLQAPAAGGVAVRDFSSAALAPMLNGGVKLAFTSGTELVSLTDSRLNVGPDTNEATVQRLYEGLLGRGSDPSGIGAFSTLLNDGVSKAAIAQVFVGSGEFVAGHGAETDGQFVQTLYEGMLGRSAMPDPALPVWTSMLAQGMTRGALAAVFADSAEAKAHLSATTAQVYVPDANGTLVHDLFETGLAREVDEGSLPLIKNALSVLTPAQLAGAIVGSAEFAADHASQSNAAYVNSLYQAGFGRAADPAGLAAWTGVLSSGAASRGGLLLSFATSGEAATHLTHNLNA